MIILSLLFTGSLVNWGTYPYKIAKNLQNLLSAATFDEITDYIVLNGNQVKTDSLAVKKVIKLKNSISLPGSIKDFEINAGADIYSK